MNGIHILAMILRPAPKFKEGDKVGPIKQNMFKDGNSSEVLKLDQSKVLTVLRYARNEELSDFTRQLPTNYFIPVEEEAIYDETLFEKLVSDELLEKLLESIEQPQEA